jgi:hypothetical protein
VATTNGNLTLKANTAGTATGQFTGIDVGAAVLQITGSGTLNLQGRGGDTGLQSKGLVFQSGAKVIGGTGTVTLSGQGGGNSLSALAENWGLYLPDTVITSNGGDILVSGTGGFGTFSAGAIIGGTISAAGSGNVTITGQGGNGGVNSMYGVVLAGVQILTAGGNVQVTGTGGTERATAASALNDGIAIEGGTVVSAGGSGTVTLLGQSGQKTSAGNGGVGVYLRDALTKITSGGGNVQVTGVAGSNAGDLALWVFNSASITTATNGGTVTLIGDSMSFDATAVISAKNTSSVTLRQRTNGTAINLGSAVDTTAGTLELSDVELDRVTAGTLQIGDANSGTITVSADISRAAATAVKLTSGDAINFTGGTLTTTGGNVTLTPGTGAGDSVGVAKAGTDVNTGAGTLAFASGSDLSIVIDGTTADTQYKQLNVAGLLNLTGVDLVLSGSHPPVLGQTFTIISNDGADAITGTFNGLAENAAITNFLGSGLWAKITYVGGTGNDVLLTVVPAAATDVSLVSGNLVITDVDTVTNDTLTLSVNGANYRIHDPNNTLYAGVGATQIDANTVEMNIASVTGNIQVNTGGGNDTLTVDYSGGSFSDAIAYDGGAGGNDVLTLTGGTFATVTHAFVNANDGSVAITGNALLSYVNLDPVNDNLDAADRVFQFTGAAETITITDSGGADGKSTIASTLGESVTFTNPTSSLKIQTSTGTGADTINITSIDAAYNVAFTVTGDDTVNLNAALTLAAGSPVSITGGTITTNAAINTNGGTVTFSATNGITLYDSVTTGGGNVSFNADSDANGTGTLTLSASVLTSWAQQAQLNGIGGAADDHFGTAVSLSSDGSTAIVGAYLDDVGANVDQGSAYVFTRSGTVWTQQAQLNAVGGAAGDFFGYAVSLSSDGNTALVGAYRDTVGGNSQQGSAYVFTRSGTVWTQQAQLNHSGGTANEQFGLAVDLNSDGNTAIVGAYRDDVGAKTAQGSAYVFTRSGTVWTQQAQLNAADGAANDNFGNAVALSSDGNTALVGAFLDDVGVNSNQGSAYVFTRSGTVWSQQAQLTAVGGAAQDIFGAEVSLSDDGNTALVGANQDDVGANSDQGSAYVFTRSGTVWTQQAQLTAADGAANDEFGTCVSLSGDGNTALIGALFDSVGANAGQGSAYAFSRSGTIWIQRAQFTAADGASGDQFGKSVTLSSDGSTALMGAFEDGVGANTFQGSAYIFSLAYNMGGTIATGAGTVSLSVADADIQANVTSTNTVSVVTSQAGRTINLGTNTAGSLSLTDAELDRITASTIQVGSAIAGTITVSAAIDTLNTNTLSLTTGGSISQNAGATITEGSLRVVSAGAVNLTQSNKVGTLAGSTTNAAANFDYTDADALTLGTVFGTSGITTTNGTITITSGGAMTISNDVTAGTNGSVFLTANSGNMAVNANVRSNAAGNGTGTLNLVTTNGNMTTNGSGLLQATGVNGTALLRSLTAGTSIGTLANPIRTDLDRLSAGGGGANISIFLTELGAVNLFNSGSAALRAGTGSVTLAGGTYIVVAADQVDDNTNLVVNFPATFNLNGQTETIGSLAGDGSVNLGNGGTLTTGNATNTTFSGSISSTGASLVVKQGAGTFTLSGNNTYAGSLNVTGGILEVAATGTVAANVRANGGGTVAGTGTITGQLTNTTASGTVAPGAAAGGAGTLNTGNLTFTNAVTFKMDVNGAGANQFDQLNVTGTVNLTNVTLSLQGGYSAAPGDTITLINNDGSDAVTGTFVGLAEGASVTVGSFKGKISYVGGSGNDVVLKDILETTVTLDGSNNLIITDINTSTNDNLKLSISGGQYRIEDLSGALLWTNIAGASGSGTSVVLVNMSSVTGTKIHVNTLTGNDTLTVDYSGGNFGIAIQYDAGAGGTDVLTLSGGTFASVTHSFVNDTDGSVAITSNSLFSYTGLDPINDNLSATNRVFDFTGGAETISITDTGGADGKTRISSTLGESVTFTNPTASMKVQTTNGTGADTINVIGLDAAYNASFTVTGDGDDTFNLNTTMTLAANNSVDITAGQINLSAATSFTVSGAGGVTFNAARNISLASTSTITAVNGNISLTANSAGTAAGNFVGIALTTATITSSGTGSITLNGTGGNAAGTDFHDGILLTSGAVIQSTSAVAGAGAISLTGKGGSGAAGNYGIVLDGNTVKITVAAGKLTLDGTAGAGTHDNFGILLNNAATISSTGGDIQVSGTGGAGSDTINIGVDIIAGSSVQASGSASLTINGTGGTGTQGQFGIAIDGIGTKVTVTSGKLTINGTGGAGTRDNFGVILDHSALVSSSGGAINIVGTGGAGSDSINYGIFMVNGADVTATNAATITFTGTGGGTGGSTIFNHGIYLTDAGTNVTSANGAILFTGLPGVSASSVGIVQQLAANVASTGSTITYVADSMNLEIGGNATISAVGNIVTLRQLTNGTKIDLGGTEAAGTLALNDTELDRITAGTLRVGDANSGAMTISATISRPAGVFSLQSGSTITENAGAVITVSGSNLAVRAGGAITLDQGNSVVSLAANTTAGGITYVESSTGGGVSVNDVDGVAGVSTNNAAINITTTDGGITITNTTAANDVDAGTGMVSLTVGQTGATTRTLTMNNSTVVRGTGGITFTANDIDIGTTATSVNAGTNSVVLQNEDVSRAIDLGTNTAGTLGLIDAELDRITAGTIIIGRNDVLAAGTVTVSAAIQHAGDANINVITGKNILFSAGWTTNNGNLSFSANRQAAPTAGTFSGIDINIAAVQATGSGTITLQGRGGNAAGGQQYGIQVRGGGDILGGTGLVTLDGIGGNNASTDNYGVFVNGASATVVTSGGNIQVTGQGGGAAGSGQANFGVFVFQGASIAAGGNGTVTVTGTGGAGTGLLNYGVFVQQPGAQITSANGSVQLNGFGGGSGAGGVNHGVVIEQGGLVSAGGTGTVAVNGTAGTGTGGSHIGVIVHLALATITSGGGNITVSGHEGSDTTSLGVVILDSGTVTTATNGGTVTLIGDSMSFNSSAVISAKTTSSVTLRQDTNNIPFDLGSTTDTNASTLELSDAELDRVTAGTINIGNANSGNITLTAAITRPASTAVNLTTAKNIIFNAGSFNTGGGTLALSPGTTGNIQPITSGTDATASTVSFAAGADVQITIGGATVVTQYRQLNVSGTVNLSGTDLVLTGAYVPAGGDVFTIVQATSRTGTFNGLNDGDTFLFNGKTLRINYTATTVTLTNVTNQPPTDLNLSNSSLPENAGVNFVIGNFSTTDPDMGDTFTYSLVTGAGSADNAAFNIAGNQLRANASFDFETQNSFSIRVRTTDAGGLFFEKQFTITVTNVNETPTDLNLSNSSLPENAGANAVVGTLSTLDPDVGDTFTYSLVAGAGSANNGLFNITGNQLRANASFDFEAGSTYSVRLRTTDAGGLFFEKQFTITVTNVNETPTDLNLSNSSLPENAGINFVIGNFSTVDPDAGDTFTYTLVAGTGSTDNGAFNIAGNQLRASNSFDFETQNSFSIRVRTTDTGGLFFEKVFTITVTNVNETPTDLNLSNNSLPENAGVNFVIGSFSTVDPDVGDTFTYTLVAGTGSTDNGSFNILGNQLRANASFDFETQNSFSIRVRSTDAGGLFFEKQFTITVTNVNETPTLVATGGPYTISEGGALNLSATVADPDVGQLLTITWDIDNNGSADATTTVNATGGNQIVTATLTWAQLNALSPTVNDGPALRNVRVRVADGGFTPFADTTLTVNNVAATATVGNSGPANEGSTTTTVNFAGQFDPSSADTTAGFHYAYDFNNDGDFSDPGEIGNGTYAGSSTAAVAIVPVAYLADGPGSRTVRMRIIDKDDGFTDYTTTIIINNVPPAPSIGGPGSSAIGAPVTFTGSFTDPAGPLDGPYLYTWTVSASNGQSVPPLAGSVAAPGAVPNYGFTPNAAGTYTVTLTIQEENGTGTTGITTQTLIVGTNLPPSGPTGFTIDPTSPGLLSSTPHYIGATATTLRFIVSGVNDPDSGDNAAGFTFQFDWNSDNTVDVQSAPGQPGVSFTFPQTFAVGLYTPRVRAVDQNGNAGVWVSLDIPILEIPAVQMVGNNLLINGTVNPDSITVNSYTTTTVTLRRNGVDYGPYNVSAGRVIIYSGDGTDLINLSGYCSYEVHAGAGNDSVYGGSGDDVLYGDDGNDFLTAGIGNDVVIGGLGKDTLQGGNDVDIIVGGMVDTTVYNFATLRAISQAWISNPNTSPPPASLSNLRNATTDPNAATEADLLNGGLGKDAFIYRASGLGLDTYSDYKAAEYDYLLAVL